MERAYQFLKEIINENDTVVVAVSAGPDSMALFDTLISLKHEKNINIICAHVNHNTGRFGQDEEQSYVEEYCKNNNIVFELYKIKDYSNDNFESEARDKRYNFFEELIKKYKAKYLLTAHHGDDLMETILMRIVRGSTLRGYSGFSKVVEKENYTILRPLIETTKDEIIKYLEDKKIKFYTDYTNLEEEHTRNRYRKYILPRLKKEDKNVHLKFLKYSNLLQEYDNYIKKETNKIIKNIYVNDKLNITEFNKLEYIIKINIIYYILEEKYDKELTNITDNHIELILDLIESNKKNTFIDLPGNIKLIKKYDYLEFKYDDNNIVDYKIELTETNKLPNGYKIDIIDSSDNNSNYICRLNKSDIKLPLYIRNRIDGDKIEIKNLNGSKKIKDIFIDKKIDIEKRNMWPVVVDSNDTIVWLPGLKKSKFDKQKTEKCDIILKYYIEEE